MEIKSARVFVHACVCLFPHFPGKHCSISAALLNYLFVLSKWQNPGLAPLFCNFKNCVYLIPKLTFFFFFF